LGLTSKLIPGSQGVYDIEVDAKILFSKHQTKQFPDNDEIIKLLKNMSS
jgi:predicted Rdx family selenoprotein